MLGGGGAGGACFAAVAAATAAAAGDGSGADEAVWGTLFLCLQMFTRDLLLLLVLDGFVPQFLLPPLLAAADDRAGG
eukprot:evm.model.NODE_31484_length_11076_cov_24.143103.3